MRRCRGAACTMGLARRLGRNGEQSGTHIPSLPSCIYLSLHPEEAGGEISLHTEQWQKKMKVFRGGGGGSRGVGGGRAAAGAGGSRERRHFSAQARSLSCRLAGGGFAIPALPGKVSFFGEIAARETVLCKGEFGK